MTSLTEAVTAEIRAEAGRQRLSGRELARRIDQPAATVSRWLRCQTAPGLDDLDAMASALEVDLGDLLQAAKRQMARRDATGHLGLPRKDSNLQPAGRRLIAHRTIGRHRRRRELHLLTTAARRRDLRLIPCGPITRARYGQDQAIVWSAPDPGDQAA